MYSLHLGLLALGIEFRVLGMGLGSYCFCFGLLGFGLLDWIFGFADPHSVL